MTSMRSSIGALRFDNATPRVGPKRRVKNNNAKNVANKINDELRGAAYRGDNAAIVTLLRHGADINAEAAVEDRRGLPVSSGHTALMFASYAGRLDTIRLLLDHGADHLKTASNGMTALDYAKSEGHEDCAAYIRLEGARAIHKRRALALQQRLKLQCEEVTDSLSPECNRETWRSHVL